MIARARVCQRQNERSDAIEAWRALRNPPTVSPNAMQQATPRFTMVDLSHAITVVVPWLIFAGSILVRFHLSMSFGPPIDTLLGSLRTSLVASISTSF